MCKTVKLNGPEVTRKSKNEEREPSDLEGRRGEREQRERAEREREREKERERVERERGCVFKRRGFKKS